MKLTDVNLADTRFFGRAWCNFLNGDIASIVLFVLGSSIGMSLV